MEAIGRVLNAKYRDRRCLVIGFAETATALSTIAANQISGDCRLLHTTREIEHPLCEYLAFSEDHSHAKNQYLHRAMLDAIAGQIDCIIVVDDEITTGKTACHMIGLLKSEYPSLCDSVFVIASLVNSMADANFTWFRNQDIRLEYLGALSLDHAGHRAGAVDACFNDYCSQSLITPPSFPIGKMPGVIRLKGKIDPRIGLPVAKYIQDCLDMNIEIITHDESILQSAKRLLVLGTEECMYPAISLGAFIEENFPYIIVRTHSTTRSPIMPLTDRGYPIHDGSKLNSFYDPDRVVYLYNIEQYDAVFVITDSEADIGRGVGSLAAALSEKGNTSIRVFVWGS
jgi:adenine/guanine phosphoribosyltransferase-like PRPP-binding protein